MGTGKQWLLMGRYFGILMAAGGFVSWLGGMGTSALILGALGTIWAVVAWKTPEEEEVLPSSKKESKTKKTTLASIEAEAAAYSQALVKLKKDYGIHKSKDKYETELSFIHDAHIEAFFFILEHWEDEETLQAAAKAMARLVPPESFEDDFKYIP